jgi:hypothetical protein
MIIYISFISSSLLSYPSSFPLLLPPFLSVVHCLSKFLVKEKENIKYLHSRLTWYLWEHHGNKLLIFKIKICVWNATLIFKII